jgi:MFS family permease
MAGDATPRPGGGAGFLTAAAAFNFSFTMLLVLVPVFAARRGYDLAAIGLLTAVPGIMQIPLRVTGGVLTDVWGSARIMRICFLASAVAALPLVTPDPGLLGLTIAQICNGVARGAFWPAAQAHASRTAADPARAISLLFTVAGAGAILSLLAAGAVADRWGFPAAFAASGAAAGVSLVAAWREPVPERPAGHRSPGRVLGPLRRLVLQRPFLVAGALAFAASVPNALAGTFYPVFALRLGFGAILATALVAVRQGGNIGGASVFAPLLERVGYPRTVRVGLWAIAASLAAVPVLRTPQLYAAGLALSGVAGQIVNLAYIWFATRNSRPEERGSALAATGLWWAAAVLLAPALFGAVAARLGLALTFLASGAAIGGLCLALSAFPALLEPGERAAAARAWGG